MIEGDEDEAKQLAEEQKHDSKDEEIDEPDSDGDDNEADGDNVMLRFDIFGQETENEALSFAGPEPPPPQARQDQHFGPEA
jgi:hypothetical protein